MRRRDFFGLAAMPAMAAAPIDIKSIKSRGTKKVDIAYKSPRRVPNGLQATREGLWVLDESRDNYVTLVNFADGKPIREFQAVGANGPSGLTVDADNVMWIDSSDNSMIFKCDHQQGKILAKYWAPGAGRTYRVKGDPKPAASTLPPAFPVPEPATKKGGRGGAAPLPYGQLPMDATTGLGGLGGQGLEFRDGLLYLSTMASRRVYVLDPKVWEVQAMWPVAGNRSHGVGWEGDTLWVADTNLRAFFRHDMKTGEIVEKIQLTEKDPVIHGVTIHDGYIWYCDVAGYVCNFKL
jgi:streptogramin lyase